MGAAVRPRFRLQHLELLALLARLLLLADGDVHLPGEKIDQGEIEMRSRGCEYHLLSSTSNNHNHNDNAIEQ